MENEELERQILEIVKEKHEASGGHNGNSFGDFDHILKMQRVDRNAFLERMAAEKKIKFYNSANSVMITLPK
ncbi:hypothetical protein MKJ01_05605 [Chryseobacterium sp. SSA4.19]|uniref:hypothetical protein n=1 Tax=Chryseobacterium sp. SSA4.19 TaxID=2919915 RepID=UPI001F4D7ED4|nr:hypothetical protein [Chryseobacterium sp. SSA4.19]MCJ8153236.1 hypothetical protein [Chryseobacterium sp. SSA4.19]